MLKFLTSILCMAFLALAAPQAQALNASAYYANDADIEALFAQAEAVNLEAVFAEVDKFQLATAFSGTSLDAVSPYGSNSLVAIVCCIFVGWLGIHRVYLGSQVELIAYYFLCTLTTVGCFIVMIDFFYMLFGEIDLFYDNDDFIVWSYF